MSVILHGYQYSVYVRIARMALAEKGVVYRRADVNPFADDVPKAYLTMHPFQRVPTLEHDGFIVYETTAITRYVDGAFEGPSLQPIEPHKCARMAQIISIIDCYGYWPMVRQVFSHRVFRPRLGEPFSEDEIRAGIDASSRVLNALESLIEGSPFLVGRHLSLADLHLAPMISYFTSAPEGETVFRRYTTLSHWWTSMVDRQSFVETDPGLPPEQEIQP